MSNTTIKPHSSAILMEDMCEVHFELGGFWDLEGIKVFLERLNECAMPLAQQKKPIYAIGDYSNFVPQDRETSEAIRDHLHFGKSVGLTRIAIINASALAKMQYKRISQGMDVEFFETKNAGLDWLRANR